MKFSNSHEWIKQKNEIATVGISDHAQRELGEIVYVELPIVGKMVKKGMELAVLESTKAASDVYSPVTGQIIEVNEELKDKPELINQFPHTKGWICKIILSHQSELESLLTEEVYQRTLQENL